MKKVFIFHKGGHFPNRWSLAGHGKNILAATVYKTHRLPQSSRNQLLSSMMQPLTFVWMLTAGHYKNFRQWPAHLFSPGRLAIIAHDYPRSLASMHSDGR